MATVVRPRKPVPAVKPPEAVSFSVPFVGLVWLASVIGALCFIHAYGSRFVPYSDDWDGIVPYYNGERPLTFDWLWSAHSEHRLVLPRLLLLGVLKLTSGDLRVVMFLNVTLLAILAIGMILVARLVRGRMSYADSFFPLALLNLSQYQNLLNAWQLQMILSPMLSGVLLCLVAARPMPWTPTVAGVGAGCLISLPLCGANGLVLAPPLALWFIYAALRIFRSNAVHATRTSLMMFSGASVCLALTAVYFIGWERPLDRPAMFQQGVRAAVEILGLAAGMEPAVAWWPVLAVGILGLVVYTAFDLLRRWWHIPRDRTRSLGLLLFLGASTALASGIGWSRVGYGPPFPIISRYVTLIVPVLCVVYLSWVVRGGVTARLVQWGLFLLLWACLWINVCDSKERAFNEIRQTTLAFEKVLEARPSIPALAKSHPFAAFSEWHFDEIELRLRGLQRSGIGPYRGLPEQLPALILDTKIDLTKPVPEYLQLGFGWHDPGAKALWSGGKAELRFWLDPIRPIWLRMSASTFQAQKLGIALNNKELANLMLNGDSFENIEVELPTDALQQNNVLTFSLPEAKSPKSVGDGDDERKIGLGISWVEFVPLIFDGAGK